MIPPPTFAAHSAHFDMGWQFSPPGHCLGTAGAHRDSPLCRSFVDDENLSDTQRNDLAVGLAAMNDVWAAIDAGPPPQRPSEYPLYRCIFSALVLRDHLHDTGRTDAQVEVSGIDLRQIAGGEEYSITVGSPSAPCLQGLWNAHMTVRLGDFLLDPTSGQTKRPWNCAPWASAFLIGNAGVKTIEIEPNLPVKVTTLHRYQEKDRLFQVAYFRLTRSVRLRTCNWQKSADARSEKRRALVAAARAIRLARITKGEGAS